MRTPKTPNKLLTIFVWAIWVLAGLALLYYSVQDIADGGSGHLLAMVALHLIFSIMFVLGTRDAKKIQPISLGQRIRAGNYSRTFAGYMNHVRGQVSGLYFRRRPVLHFKSTSIQTNKDDSSSGCVFAVIVLAAILSMEVIGTIIFGKNSLVTSILVGTTGLVFFVIFLVIENR